MGMANLVKLDRLYKPWDETHNTFGNVVVLGFVIVQYLDGILTYLGVSTWGLTIEANPVVSSVMAYGGLGAGLVTAKLTAIALGIVLHMQRVHHLVAFLTLFYVAAAILPWTALFLTH